MSSSEVAQRRGSRPDRPPRIGTNRPPAASLAVRIKALGLTIGLFVVTLGIGWCFWSVVEWRKGRTASYRITGLRVVRRSDGRPVGLARSILRNAVCCTILLIPTILVCLLLSFAFVMGASAPDGLLREPRLAPWDLLTGTEVLDERAEIGPWSLRPGRWPDPAGINMN